MNNEFIIIDAKIEQMEEILGREITAEENLEILGDFYNKFQRLADELNISVMSILDDFDLMVELDELISYNLLLAKKRALEVLNSE